MDFLKIVGAILLVAASGFQLAKWADRYVGRGAPDPEGMAERVGADRSASEDKPDAGALPRRRGPMESMIESFLLSPEPLLQRKLKALDASQLEEFLIESLAFDLESSRAFEAAGLALKALAARDPVRALALLQAVSPAEKERLATALSAGWARFDPVSAWDWIDTAWMDPNGAYIDRELQRRMFRQTLNVVLEEDEDFQMAADLLASVVEPDLQLELADLIAFHVVSKNPARALDRMRFQGDETLGSAIMDAVIAEWAQRDSIGAMAWTLENQRQVTSQGVAKIAKDLLLNGVHQELADFHRQVEDPYKRDAIASESARLMARRYPRDSISWLAGIESTGSRYDAYYDALYEIGHDDFASVVDYAELAHRVAKLDRETVFFEALQSWTLVDPDRVRAYLDHTRGAFADSRLIARLRSGLN